MTKTEKAASVGQQTNSTPQYKLQPLSWSVGKISIFDDQRRIGGATGKYSQSRRRTVKPCDTVGSL